MITSNIILLVSGIVLFIVHAEQGNDAIPLISRIIGLIIMMVSIYHLYIMQTGTALL